MYCASDAEATLCTYRLFNVCVGYGIYTWERSSRVYMYRLFNVLCWLWNIYEGTELPSV